MNDIFHHDWQQIHSIADVRRYFRNISNERLPMHWLDGWLLFVLDKPKHHLITHGDDSLDVEQKQQLHAGMMRMMQGEPLAYLTGRQGFWRDEFLVNKYTLIPRADTERLIEVVLDQVRSDARFCAAGSLLDLGAGSGCIGLSLAKELPTWQVLLVDNSPQALAVVEKNITHLAIENAQCCLSSWFDAVKGRFDIIVSNPPYIDASDVHLSALTAEPRSALVADEAGLADIRHIITHARTHLAEGGLLVIEHGYDQAKQVQEIFQQARFHHVQSFQDYGGNDRLTMGRWHDTIK